MASSTIIQQNENLGLDYLTPELVRGSNLDETSKNAFLHQLEDISARFFTIEPMSRDDLDNLNDWRDLSVRFYQQVGIEGVMYDDWPIGLQSAEGYVIVENRIMTMQEMADLEPISMDEYHARQQELDAEMEQLMELAPGTLEADVQTEEVRQRFEEWDDFGWPERENR